jgi:hypothetical protein
LKPSLQLFALLTILSPALGHSQNISGRVVDENNNPIAFANLFVRETEGGTSANAKGEYFLTIDPGVYHIAVSSIGYTSTQAEIVITDRPVVKDFVLQSSSVELSQIEIKVRRRDPAYEIIQKTIANREKNLSLVNSYRANVYLKANEVVDKKKRKHEEEKDDDDDLKKKDGTPIDPFEAARKKEEARLQGINLLEMQVTVNFQNPDKYKEERTAYKAYGTKDGLFVPVFSQTDFNFYHNLVHLKGIAEIPMISPISKTAILSYKYRLEQTLKEDGQTIYKIRVTARKAGDATCNGVLFINDSTWNINRLELTMHKGALKFYDDFTIKQSYQKVDSSLWIPFRQEFDYQTKAGQKTFKGNTVLIYSNYERNISFPPKFFGNEVSVITQEAYERDTTYWKQARPEPLTEDQKKVVAYRDSIEAAHKSKTYLDSIEAKYNKVTLGELIYGGVSFRKQSNKSYLDLPPVLGLIGLEVIGGLRLGPYVSYGRRFKNERWFNSTVQASVGLKNMDWQGGARFRSLYNPYRLGWFGVDVGRQFQMINGFDAYLNQLKISNYIVHDHLDIYHRKEIFNGFYLRTDFHLSDRRSIVDYDPTWILNEVIKVDSAIQFQNYQAFISHLGMYYTPFQKFMREPNRKVVLGSKYPTFIFNHRKGWDNIFGSDINFDYIDFGVDHTVQFGTLGNSRYTLTLGKFVNSRDLRYVDFKRFRQSDPYLYSDPMHSFQLLDTALNATDWFFEAHYMHHFNGAMINNLPLIKKLKLRTVAGAGMMWIKESGYRHEEIFGGVERVFKVGARRRLKIGFYGVLGQSNADAPKADWKVSFDLIDTWKRNWSY